MYEKYLRVNSGHRQMSCVELHTTSGVRTTSKNMQTHTASERLKFISNAVLSKYIDIKSNEVLALRRGINAIRRLSVTSWSTFVQLF